MVNKRTFPLEEEWYTLEKKEKTKIYTDIVNVESSPLLFIV
jgi:hypothetical protein